MNAVRSLARIHRGLVAAIALAPLMLLSLSAAPAAVDGPDDKALIRKLLDDQVVAWNRGDLDAFMAGYWKSPKLTFFSGNDIQHGWQETMDRYRSRYQGEGKEMGKLVFSEIAIHLSEKDARAWVTGRWKLALSKSNPEGLFTLIVERKDGAWRIIHDHTSAAQK